MEPVDEQATVAAASAIAAAAIAVAAAAAERSAVGRTRPEPDDDAHPVLVERVHLRENLKRRDTDGCVFVVSRVSNARAQLHQRRSTARRVRLRTMRRDACSRQMTSVVEVQKYYESAARRTNSAGGIAMDHLGNIYSPRRPLKWPTSRNICYSSLYKTVQHRTSSRRRHKLTIE